MTPTRNTAPLGAPRYEVGSSMLLYLDTRSPTGVDLLADGGLHNQEQ